MAAKLLDEIVSLNTGDVGNVSSGMKVDGIFNKTAWARELTGDASLVEIGVQCAPENDPNKYVNIPGVEVMIPESNKSACVDFSTPSFFIRFIVIKKSAQASTCEMRVQGQE